MYPIRYNTASQEIPLGYFLDSTDGNTEETGLTVANTDIKLHKTGATTLANKNSGGATHISNGIMYAVLDDTDTNTLGPMVIFVHVAGALAVRLECCVYPQKVYDSLFLGTDNLEIDIIQLLGSAIATPTNAGVMEVDITHSLGTPITSDPADVNVASIANNAITTASIADGAFTAAKFAAGAFDAVWSVATRLLTAGTNIILAKGTGVTGFNDLSAAQVNAEADTAIADAGLATDAALATVDGNVDAIKAKTDNLPTDPADQSLLIAATDAIITAIGNLNNLSAAQVNSECDTAIADAALATAANLAAAKAVVDAIKLKTDNLPASPASTSDIAAALATYDAPTKAELDSAVASLATAAALSSVAGNVTAIKVITDALTAVAAARLALSAGQIIPGTIDNTFTPTTTEFEADDITESTADHYNGRVIIFTSGPLSGQATSISDYSLSSGRGHFTVVALTEAPSNDNTFIIV